MKIKMKIRNKSSIETFCKYCEHATPLATGNKLVCAKYGVVSEDYKCRKFIYDPLKRAPKMLTFDGLEIDDEALGEETNTEI